MNFQELNIRRSYINHGDDNLVQAFLLPVLKCAKRYQRSVGFFSSSVFGPITDGVVDLSRNGGQIELIASPRLNEEDMQAINLGYRERQQIIENAFTRDFLKELEKLEDAKLQLLAELVAKSILDIKIAVTCTAGMYHDKLGVLEDCEGNRIAYFGSPNASQGGYQDNYEKIRVVRGWVPAEAECVEDEYREFASLWSGANPYVDVYEYTQAAQANILSVIQLRSTLSQHGGTAEPVKLRDYQEEAIQAWVANGYHGFFVMATGTGKTWTAIYSARRLVAVHPVLMVICAPYKHLVRQWTEDLEKVFPKAKIIMVSSENHDWQQQITREIIRKQYYPDNQIIIVSTIASFKMPRFQAALSKSTEEKLLIVDEAHRFTDRQDSLKDTFSYLLGLSATPYSGTEAQKGRELMAWFGGQVFDLPIETALERSFLVPYRYVPVYVHATEADEQKFKFFSQKIASCFRKGKCINSDLLIKSLRGRLRVISMAEEKQNRIHEIIERLPETDHVVVYCGDGKLFDANEAAELRHIQTIKRVLSAHGWKTSQFTAAETMNERMELVDAFNKGELSALVAIRCLDEGINIPSIKSALILSSNDDYREFVQRRGRILRTYPGKESAAIYDVIVLPSTKLQSWAKIELRRFYEYGRLALNWGELREELNNHLYTYSLSMEDIDVYDYAELEEPLDE
ncbi:hypothetical protein N510_003147 [Firmicutes bacterium ASF500]|nr:hypothetical protein N510_003147 [Firmicutes bacterium ASF500]